MPHFSRYEALFTHFALVRPLSRVVAHVNLKCFSSFARFVANVALDFRLSFSLSAFDAMSVTSMNVEAAHRIECSVAYITHVIASRFVLFSAMFVALFGAKKRFRAEETGNRC